MNIAYLFHGHSRTWKQCFHNFFENIFSIAPGDIFIHTWEKVNTHLGSHWNSWAPLSGDRLAISQEHADITGIIKNYKPKIIIVEQDPGIDDKLIPPGHHDYNAMKAHMAVKNMLHGSRKIFDQAMQVKQYDRIFSTRLDINYTSKLDLAEIQDTKLRIPKNLALDAWMFGTTENMDIKTNYYSNIEKYWYNNGMIGHYEYQLENYLRDNNIIRDSNMLFSSLDSAIIRLF